MLLHKNVSFTTRGPSYTRGPQHKGSTVFLRAVYWLFIEEMRKLSTSFLILRESCISYQQRNSIKCIKLEDSREVLQSGGNPARQLDLQDFRPVHLRTSHLNHFQMETELELLQTSK